MAVLGMGCRKSPSPRVARGEVLGLSPRPSPGPTWDERPCILAGMRFPAPTVAGEEEEEGGRPPAGTGGPQPLRESCWMGLLNPFSQEGERERRRTKAVLGRLRVVEMFGTCWKFPVPNRNSVSELLGEVCMSPLVWRCDGALSRLITTTTK